MYADLVRIIQDLASPPYCSFCWQLLTDRVPLCNFCKSKICPVVSENLPYTARLQMKVYAIGAYDDPLKMFIRAKNYRSFLSAHQLGILMSETLSHHIIPERDILVPVPLHWSRYAWRGFNQAEVMAKVIGSQRGVPVLSLLSRNRSTKYQASCAADERQDNVAKAFSLNSSLIKQCEGKRIILIDDLMTTGATLVAAARTLRIVTEEVCALVAARVI